MPDISYQPDGLPTPAALRQLFAYNPHNGRLSWKVKRGPRIKPGDEAGTVLLDGTVVVNLDGKRYQAARVVWAIHYGEWPSEPLRFWGVDFPGVDLATKVARRQNLAIDKLSLRSAAMAETDLTKRREYERLKRQRDLNVAQRFDELPVRWSQVPTEGVEWSPSRKKWQVLSVPKEGSDLSYIIFQSYHQPDAEAFNQQYRDGLAFLDAHPEPVIEDPQVRRRRAGRTGHELGWLHRTFAYDPVGGRILWRAHPQKRGLSAVHRNPKNRFFVSTEGHAYPPHLLAWFLFHHYWPERRRIYMADGDPSNIKLSNLKRRYEDA